MMMTVSQLLDSKGHGVLSVSPQTTVYDALKLMAEKGVGALVVLDKGRIVGMCSERDYARKVVLKGKSSKNTPVADIMTTSVCYVPPWRTIDECMALMTDKHVRHLPVLENEKLVGLISIGDVVKAIISEQEFAIKELEAFADVALKDRAKKSAKK